MWMRPCGDDEFSCGAIEHVACGLEMGGGGKDRVGLVIIDGEDGADGGITLDIRGTIQWVKGDQIGATMGGGDVNGVFVFFREEHVTCVGLGYVGDENVVGDEVQPLLDIA